MTTQSITEPIVFLGGGMMGGAILAGLIKSNVPSSLIRVVEIDSDRRDKLKSLYPDILVTDNLVEGTTGATIAILAIKPQQTIALLTEIKEKQILLPQTLIFSVVSGFTVSQMRELLESPEQPVIRTMPNTPSTIGMGMTVWFASDKVTDSQRDNSMTILSAMGEEVRVETENMIEKGVLSGSGPAITFLFMEALIDVGVHMGFSSNLSRKLVVNMVRGSSEYARQFSETHMAELRAQVVSPAGATAEAIFSLEKDGIRAALSSAIWAACNRAADLGKQQP
jgi:pyrroline-5-carboxylate reductase